MGATTKVVNRAPGSVQGLTNNVANSLNGMGVGGTQAQNPGMPIWAQMRAANPVQTQFSSGQDINRGQIGGVSAPGTQSIDQLGGANSAFFQNMMNQLNPAFQQQRANTMAMAKEGAGNLSGSGLANGIGTAMGRTLGDQQAQLAQYAAQGVNQEAARQAQQAALGLQAGQSNQGADIAFLNQLLQRNQQGLQAQGMGLQGQEANQGVQQQANLANANNQQQANMLGYQTQAQTANENAQRIAQLMSYLSGIGASSGQIQQSGGIGALLGPLGSIGGQILGGPLGGMLGGKIMGMLGGGGGGGPVTDPTGGTGVGGLAPQFSSLFGSSNLGSMFGGQ